MEVFNGIRYAKTGRWERPVLEPRLVAIADIETQVQICPQPPCMLDSVIGNTDNGEQQGEDCLRLSVFTPSTQGKGIKASCHVCNWRHDSKPGAVHCIELPLIFGNYQTWKDAPLLKGVTQSEYDQKSREMKQSIIEKCCN